MGNYVVIYCKASIVITAIVCYIAVREVLNSSNYGCGVAINRRTASSIGKEEGKEKRKVSDGER